MPEARIREGASSDVAHYPSCSSDDYVHPSFKPGYSMTAPCLDCFASGTVAVIISFATLEVLAVAEVLTHFKYDPGL